jgi:hypothetical protein
LRVFLSHALADNDIANRVAGILGEVGVTTLELTPGLGEEWLKALVSELNKADAVVVLVTPNSARSNWLYTEYSVLLSAAQQRDLKLVPLVFGDETDVPTLLSSRVYRLIRSDEDIYKVAREIMELRGVPKDDTKVAPSTGVADQTSSVDPLLATPHLEAAIQMRMLQVKLQWKIAQQERYIQAITASFMALGTSFAIYSAIEWSSGEYDWLILGLGALATTAGVLAGAVALRASGLLDGAATALKGKNLANAVISLLQRMIGR